AAIAKVHVIRDNKYVYSTEPKTRDVKLRYTDADAGPGKTSYYYVRIEQADGNLAWASPMWITYKKRAGCRRALALRPGGHSAAVRAVRHVRRHLPGRADAGDEPAAPAPFEAEADAACPGRAHLVHLHVRARALQHRLAVLDPRLDVLHGL